MANNANEGALFRNDKKGNERRPDYKGSINANGVDFWVSAWVKESKRDGSKFLSLSLEPQDKQQTSSAPQPQQSAPAPQQPVPAPAPQVGEVPDKEDDLPF